MVDPWAAAWAALPPGQQPLDVAAWSARRADLSLGTTPWGTPGLDAARLIDSALRLHDGGYLGAELALVEAAVEQGLLEPIRAAAARAVLADLASGALDAEGLQQRVNQIDLRARGSLLSLLPLECLGAATVDPVSLQRIASAELAVPPWRVASSREVLPSPPEAVPALETAARLLGRARRPDLAPVVPIEPGRCWVDGLDLLAVVGELDASQRAAVMPALQTLGEVYDLPASLAVSLAARGYLDDDAASLALAVRWAEGHGVAPFVRALELSVRTTDGDGPEVLGPVVDALPAADDAFESWVRGELLRRAQRADASLEPLNAAIGADPWFAAALISRSSALVALGRGYDALSDLQHLRVIYPAATPYAALIDALDRRLR